MDKATRVFSDDSCNGGGGGPLLSGGAGGEQVGITSVGGGDTTGADVAFTGNWREKGPAGIRLEP